MNNDNYLNYTGLDYYHSRLETKLAATYATIVALNALSDRVDDIVAEGGEPNVIEVVQKNGTALPVSNKTVNVTVPTTVAELSDSSDYAEVSDIPTKTSDLTNDGDGTDSNSPFATQAYVTANGGKIDIIKVNGTTQTITNKTVDITVPTKTSDITNDSGFQTATEVQTAIDTAVASSFTYKGSVATADNLPSSGNKTGDVYDVQDTGMNYAWNGTSWDALGQLIDASAFWSKTELTAITTAQIDTIVGS